MRALVFLSLAACSSGPHVSPYAGVDLSTYLRQANDLPTQTERARREAAAEGLREITTVDAVFPSGQPFVALGFVGVDAAGRPVHAARVVTPAAIVLALGPARALGEGPPRPDELLASLLPGGAYPSGSDLSGDGAPDVVLRAADGSLAIHRIDMSGSAPYPITLRFPPTDARDVNEDGRPDLTGHPPLPDDDPLRPALLDVAIADRVTFRNDHPDALAFHQALATRPPPASDTPPATQLRAALETAFHAVLAGAPPADALAPADRLVRRPLPADLVASFALWRSWISAQTSIPARPSP